MTSYDGVGGILEEGNDSFLPVEIPHYKHFSFNNFSNELSLNSFTNFHNYLNDKELNDPHLQFASLSSTVLLSIRYSSLVAICNRYYQNLQDSVKVFSLYLAFKVNFDSLFGLE
jgi:hypothetical protein